MSRFLCVEVEDVDQHRAQGGAGIFDAIRLLPGVRRVVDLSAVSHTTLDGMLLPHDQTWEHTQRKRKRQP